ncbi:cytochrome P450 [Saccharothrix xinjiangensis]|uniref:Cytochrome P450 n=1 Tax=Saccharothrix xinjiangensis TaxID=204798 RepID=A0ABV9Y4B4_9PSEU
MIPHPPLRLPLLGDVLRVSARTPVQDAVRLSRRLGPVFELKAFDRRFAFVCGAELVAELADETRFTKHVPPGVEAMRGMLGDGLFTAHEHEPGWRVAHDVLVPAFSQGALRRYHGTMLEVAGQLLDRWDRAGGPVDVPADMTRLALETIGRTGFGYSFGSFSRPEAHPFVTAMLRGLRYSQRSTTLPAAATALFGRRARRRYLADAAAMHRLVDEVIRSRTGSGDDMLGLMLESGRLDDVNTRHQVITFLMAGHETTSSGLAFALHHLSRDPAALARARSEVDSVWPAEPEPPAFEQVARLRYVRQVLDEALRLNPPVPGFARRARADTELGGLPVRAGQWFMVLVPALHRDPVWGPDAESFDPDRFAPAAVRARPAHVFKPFGTGARACIGRQFALHEMTLVLGLLLRRYDLAPDPGYRLSVRETLTLSPRGLTLRPTRRDPVSASGPA